MKYKDLIQFEPINEVIQFSKTENEDYQKSLVKSYVFSDRIKEDLLPLIIRNLDYTHTGDSFGLQIVGNYGTGKSHMMSLVAAIAENAEYLDLIQEDKPKSDLASIAGKYKVLKFELGNTEDLWQIVTYKIEDYFEQIGIDFSFDTDKPLSYSEKIALMMAEFEERFPDKGFLIIIDEMLSYLKGRGEATKLNQDLQVLQALGQSADSSKFKIMFGVQEMIYHSAEFQFAAEMLSKVHDRYKDILITKDDVSYIVKNRLLKKDEHQKQSIRKHLDNFLKYFSDMHGRTEEYVELFPVHPTYFENFEKIKIGKSQREILKTLSGQFKDLLDKEVPTDNPGLLTYDHYWEDIKNSQNLMAIPDVRSVKNISDTAKEKIETHFTGARAGKQPIAKRILNACSIRILQAELSKQNGTTSENLVDDLCLTDKMALDRDFLIDIIDSSAQQLIKATSGSYFDKNPDNGEYHLRIEGGVNYDQKIKDYAQTMSDSQKDEYYFKFLEMALPLDYATYRTGFKIWAHTIEWKSHKIYRDGYIFFGNPSEKSTTEPKQHFYLYFMPIFDLESMIMNNEEDEVYFKMNLSKNFKEIINLYGAAQSLQVRADSTQKKVYQDKVNDFFKKARDLFDLEYVQNTNVSYLGKELPLNAYQLLPGRGSSKEEIFSQVASTVLEPWFSRETPDYPKFTELNGSLEKDNFSSMINAALAKVVEVEKPNRNGEAILHGLALYKPGKLEFKESIYAQSILKKLKDKGKGKVLNRDEILKCIWAETNLWVSLDYNIEAEFQFIVLAVLAALGEIEITLTSGKTINASTLKEIKSLASHDYYAFTHIKPPKGVNLAALKELFTGLTGKDLSNRLKQPETYTELITKAQEWSKRAVTLEHELKTGIRLYGIEILTMEEAKDICFNLTILSRFCDQVSNYTTEAKIKNFDKSIETIERALKFKNEVIKYENLLKDVESYKTDISYLQQCKQYITDTNFKNSIDFAINSLGEKLQSEDKAIQNSYQKELADLKEKYAKLYLEKYLASHISSSDNTKKEALLDSEEKELCDIINKSGLTTNTKYHSWLRNIQKLKAADSKVNKELILAAPYQNFNPLEYQNFEVKSISELKNELLDIYAEEVESLKDILDDPIVKKNKTLLEKETLDYLEKFTKDEIKLSRANIGKVLKGLKDLQKGLLPVELTFDSLAQSFSKPLTPDEALKTFKKHLENLTLGKEQDKVRIILKQD